MALSVAGRIEPTVQAAEMRRALAQQTEDMGSYDLTLRTVSLFWNTTKPNVLAAIELLDRAVALGPAMATPWRWRRSATAWS